MDIPFPELPKTIWAVIVPWAIALSLLYFDFAQNYRTNPILMFGFPILVTIVFMPKDSFESIRESLGLHFPDIMDKLLNIAGIFVGAGIGFLFYIFLSHQASIIPLYFASEITQYLAATKDMSSVLIIYAVVAVSEEFMRVLFSKISANSLSGRFNINRTTAILFGTMIAGLAWASLHWFAYGGTTGMESYFVAWTLGEIFAIACIGFGMIRNNAYYILPAISAHFLFDVMIALNLAYILV